jgi:predicted TIM-barrel fold metal-dependent hydrolase
MKAIDVHGHFGTLDLGGGGLVTQLKSGDIDVIRRRADAVGVCLTVVSALRAFFPYGGDVLGGNEEARAAAEKHADIRFWAVLDPRIRETYAQVESLLAHPRCRGIKIHPTCHDFPIREYGDDVFAFAADHGTIIMTHTGDANCFPEAFIPFANRYSGVSLILAHMGYSSDGNFSRQVYALKQARAGNVYVDTSSAMSMLGGLVEWAVSQVGSGNLLFGTDTPLYSVASQKARIEYANLDEPARQAILFDNASRLLGEEQMGCEEVQS